MLVADLQTDFLDAPQTMVFVGSKQRTVRTDLNPVIEVDKLELLFVSGTHGLGPRTDTGGFQCVLGRVKGHLAHCFLLRDVLPTRGVD